MFKSKNILLEKLLLRFSISFFLFALFSASATIEIEDTEAEIEKLTRAEQIEKEDVKDLQQKSSSEQPANQEPKLPCPHVPECTG